MNVRRLSALLLLCVAFATIPANAASPNVVISQVYGGGGGTSGPPVYSYDYVEIFNRSADDVPIGGWSVQYGSTTGQFGSSSSNIFVFPAGTSIGAGQYLTVRGATSSTAVGAPITGDFSSSLSLAAGGGKVALTTVSATLGCGATATPCVLPDARIVDAVAYGNSNNGEGGVSANGGVAINATVGALRKDGGCQDTDNNNSDFLIVNVAGGLVPRTAGTPTRSCGGVEPPANAAPVITAPANPITTVEQDAAPFDVVLRGTDDSNVFNWTATAGTGVSAVAAIGGASTFEVTFRVSIVSGFSGTASFTATLSDGVSSDTETVNIAVNAGPPPPVDHITISQVYGGGANSGAAFRHDYVELYNPTLNTIDVNGWSVQYASAAGDFAQAQPLAGVMPPGTYYLVRLGTQNSNGPGALLPPANIEGDINMSGSNGKVALVRQQAPLFTGCTNALIIDLVGYGSANCSEGGLSAPAIPGNTSAIFRKNDGLTDTNVNRNDFETGAASPRRTAPIAEFGPRVSGHEPDENGAPRDVSVVLFFNEPVDIDLLGNWYDISCATTGSHDGGAVASRFNNTRWIITPETNFAPGEQCTVTIRATFVRDQDLDDAPGTDTLASDYTFTFDIATGAEPPHAPSVHLTMGNPSGAETNLSTPNNYLMVKPEFALSYNRDRGTANWVSWHLADEWQCCQPRPDDDPFRPDPALPDDWYLVLDEDYSGTGFDRGHVVPNADRNLSGAIPIQQATFLMTNMIPQSPNSNQGPWEKFERHLRDAFVDSSYEVYVVAGGAGVGGTGSNGFATTIANGKVTVPAVSWKVALIVPSESGDDVRRVTGSTRTIAVVVPNVQGILNDDWRPYLTSVDAVEALTGYDFFSNVADAVENAIEAGVDGANPPGAAAQSVTTDEDVAKTFTLDAAAGGSATLTYTIVSSTSQGTLSLSGNTATYTPAPNFFGTDSFTWSVSDGSKSASATVTINVQSVNDLPVATVSAPALAHEGDAVTATVTASDIETANLAYSWTVTKNGAPFTSGAGAATFTFTPDAAGTWVVTATATDADGASATSSASITVVDPEGGFVTGGGFFDAPTGRAIFNVGSKYLGNVPSGNTNLKTAGVDFNSTAQAWLTIVGNKAQFAGEGTVNRTAGYAFIVTVEDGATDKIRFRIWEKATGTVVFDNGAEQPIGGGSIQIHQ